MRNRVARKIQRRYGRGDLDYFLAQSGGLMFVVYAWKPFDNSASKLVCLFSIIGGQEEHASDNANRSFVVQ